MIFIEKTYLKYILFIKAIAQGRQAKEMTQKELAAKIQEKPQVSNNKIFSVFTLSIGTERKWHHLLLNMQTTLKSRHKCLYLLIKPILKQIFAISPLLLCLDSYH